MITIAKEYYTGGPPDLTMLQNCVTRHLAEIPRLEKLKAYWDNRNPGITEKTRRTGQADVRTPHAFARYIVLMASGYLVGQPVRYNEEDGRDISALRAAFKATNADSVDNELAVDASIYGKGIELIYANENAEARSASLNPEDAFVVYDDTVENRPLFGVHTIRKFKPDGTDDGFAVNVYTATEEWQYRCSSLGAVASARQEGCVPHFFGAVPMIEYWNNADETGDFESVLPQIDAYDLLESDRVNDKENFVDSMLVLTGCTLEQTYHEEEINGETVQVPDENPAAKLRRERCLTLPDTDASAQYLSNTFHETDTEVLRTALKEDIHKFSLIPDMTDQNFASNASGVAMKYKLLGLEQLTQIKERWFREGLTHRIREYANFLAMKGAMRADGIDGVQIVFTRALPVNELEVAQTLQAYSGLVPEALLMAQVPFVDDTQRALEIKKQEDEEKAEQTLRTFGGFGDIADSGETR